MWPWRQNFTDENLALHVMMLDVEFYRLYNVLRACDFMPCLCRNFFVIFTKVCGVFKTIFAVQCYAECGYATVCLSVRPSVTFRYRDHISWNFSNIISRPNSLRHMHRLTPTWQSQKDSIIDLRAAIDTSFPFLFDAYNVYHLNLYNICRSFAWKWTKSFQPQGSPGGSASWNRWWPRWPDPRYRSAAFGKSSI